MSYGMNVALVACAIGVSLLTLALLVVFALRGLRKSAPNRRAVDLDILRAMGQPAPGEHIAAEERKPPPAAATDTTTSESLFTPKPQEE
jgi:hypothetical protein